MPPSTPREHGPSPPPRTPAGARLVHISSLAAAGPAHASTPRGEDDAPAPLTPYGRSKLDSERALLAFPSLRWTILRPGVVYGPGDRAVLPLFKLAAGLVAPVVGRPDAAYTFVYISDVVRAIEAALEGTSVGGTFFVGHPQPVTPRGLLETIQKTIGRRSALVTVPMPVTRVAAEVCDVVGRVTGRAMLINRWRYAELAAEGFVCRVDRMRDVLGVAGRGRSCERDCEDGGVVPERGLAIETVNCGIWSSGYLVIGLMHSMPK